MALTIGTLSSFLHCDIANGLLLEWNLNGSNDALLLEGNDVSRKKYFWCCNFIAMNKYNDRGWYGTNLTCIYIISNVFVMKKKRNKKKFWKILLFQKSFRFWVQEGSDIVKFFYLFEFIF